MCRYWIETGLVAGTDAFCYVENIPFATNTRKLFGHHLGIRFVYVLVSLISRCNNAQPQMSSVDQYV